MTASRPRSALAAARRAAGHTQESLASALQVDRTTVVRWEAGERTPLPHLQPKLARLLGQSQGQLSALITGDNQQAVELDGPTGAELSIALDWLDEHTGWAPGTSRGRVAAQLSRVSIREQGMHKPLRRKVNLSRLADALRDYYPDSADYCVTCAGRDVATGVVSRAGWLDLRCLLTPTTDQLMLVNSIVDDEVALDDVGARHAVHRLADAVTGDVRITNAPIYRLLDVDVAPGTIGGAVGLTPFVRYALTMDLLETELTEALLAGIKCQPGLLPLRDRYLPDLPSVMDVAGRLCVGGTLALCAVARPADPYRGAPDYALVIQERSDVVINAVRRLSVIPKGFHEPMTDVRSDARIGATLLREIEEELFGRGDVDNTRGEYRVAAPMHPSRLSEPMRWLLAEPGRLRMECTGFGLNLVSGNYEFASLIVIEDEEFWSRFGGAIEANWESSSLHLYSSLDTRTLAELAWRESWSGEGLFALLLGLRRLAEIDGRKVDLPAMENHLGR